MEFSTLDEEQKKLEDTIRKFNAAELRLKEQTKEYIEFLYHYLFKEYPVEEIYITGCVPYYNDGEPCTFGTDLDWPNIELKEGLTTEEQNEAIDDIICHLNFIPEKVLQKLYSEKGIEIKMTKDKLEYIEEFTNHE